MMHSLGRPRPDPFRTRRGAKTEGEERVPGRAPAATHAHNGQAGDGRSGGSRGGRPTSSNPGDGPAGRTIRPTRPKTGTGHRTVNEAARRESTANPGEPRP